MISVCFVPACAEQDVRHPIRRSVHLLTADIQVKFGITFNDQLIMNMSSNKVVQESFRCIAEDVPADSLYDILNELRIGGPNGFHFFDKSTPS